MVRPIEPNPTEIIRAKSEYSLPRSHVNAICHSAKFAKGKLINKFKEAAMGQVVYELHSPSAGTQNKASGAEVTWVKDLAEHDKAQTGERFEIILITSSLSLTSKLEPATNRLRYWEAGQVVWDVLGDQVGHDLHRDDDDTEEVGGREEKQALAIRQGLSGPEFSEEEGARRMPTTKNAN